MTYLALFNLTEIKTSVTYYFCGCCLQWEYNGWSNYRNQEEKKKKTMGKWVLEKGLVKSKWYEWGNVEGWGLFGDQEISQYRRKGRLITLIMLEKVL